jgi:hypothetical protein
MPHQICPDDARIKPGLPIPCMVRAIGALFREFLALFNIGARNNGITLEDISVLLGRERRVKTKFGPILML